MIIADIITYISTDTEKVYIYDISGTMLPYASSNS